jgi:amidase
MVLKLRPSTVIPISSHQDTIGPMARSTGDAAIVLSVIAGPDSSDNATNSQPSPLPDYTRALRKDSLRGKRIGVPRHVFLNDTVTGNDPSVNIAFNNALKTIRELGATVVDPSDLPTAEQVIEIGFYNETFVLEVDFKVCMLYL